MSCLMRLVGFGRSAVGSASVADGWGVGQPAQEHLMMAGRDEVDDWSISCCSAGGVVYDR